MFAAAACSGVGVAVGGGGVAAVDVGAAGLLPAAAACGGVGVAVNVGAVAAVDVGAVWGAAGLPAAAIRGGGVAVGENAADSVDAAVAVGKDVADGVAVGAAGVRGGAEPAGALSEQPASSGVHSAAATSANRSARRSAFGRGADDAPSDIAHELELVYGGGYFRVRLTRFKSATLGIRRSPKGFLEWVSSWGWSMLAAIIIIHSAAGRAHRVRLRLRYADFAARGNGSGIPVAAAMLALISPRGGMRGARRGNIVAGGACFAFNYRGDAAKMHGKGLYPNWTCPQDDHTRPPPVPWHEAAVSG